MNLLSAPEALEVAMNSLGYEYQGDFARRYIAQGRAEAFAEGQTGVLLGVLAYQFWGIDSDNSDASQWCARGRLG